MNCENFLSEASSDRIRDVSLAMTRRCGETKKASDQMCWKHIMCADEQTFVTVRPPGKTMLVTKTHYDIPSRLDSGRPIRIYVISPNVPDYPQAKFPGKSCSMHQV